MHSGHHQTLHSAKHITNAKKAENTLHGSTFSAAAPLQGNSPDDGIGAKPLGPQYLMTVGTPQDNLPGSDCGSVCRGGAEVSPTRRQRSAWVNLRGCFRVGAWNVLSQREDDHLSLLSSELKRLDTSIVALSEVR